MQTRVAGRWSSCVFYGIPRRVWAALTDPVQVGAWSPFTADRDLGRVGDATLTMLDGDVREDLPARVARAERPRLLEYTWGTDRLRWELAPSTPARV